MPISRTGSSTGGSSAPDTQAATILTRTIPSSGEPLPVIGLGTWQAFDVGRDREARARLAEVLRAFTARGGRLVDSSPMYGSAEQVIGDLTAELGIRDQLFLATKVWIEGQRASIRQMGQSMRRLGADVIDLMQVHNLVDVETHLPTLEVWKREGLVRYVGVTHYAGSHHAAVARILERHAVDFVQINYSAVEREAEGRLLPLARERGIAVIANRPFAEGALLRRLRDTPVPPWAADIECTSWAQLLLKFVISHPAITCVIPATSDPDHLRDNMRAAMGPLPDGELRVRIARALT